MQEKISKAEEKIEIIRNTVGLFLGPVIFFFVLLLPITGLDPKAHRLAAILAFTIIYWICEPIPIPVTALLSASLCVLMKIADAKPILASFADPVVFLFLGSFILAKAMTAHNLDRRIALTLLSIRWVGNKTKRVLLVYGGIAAFLSMWLSNTATTAMLLPIGLGILYEIRDLADKQRNQKLDLRTSKISTGMMLMAAYGASIGGISTPIGTPPNLIGIGMIRKILDIQINFFEWMKFALPLVVIMFFILYQLILRMQKPEIDHLSGLSDYIHNRKKELGMWTIGQTNTIIAFMFAVTLWIMPGFLSLIFGPGSNALKLYSAILPEGVIALFAASLLFLLPVNWKKREFTITWKEAVQIDWGTILLFGGGIALGSLSFSTGLAEYIGNGIISLTGVSSLSGITAISIILGILVSETTSNTASANMIIPISIAVSQSAGLNPIAPALGACLGASYGFMLPVSTPPNAIAYGTGMVPITRMIKNGIFFDILGFFVIWLGISYLIPLMGF